MPQTPMPSSSEYQVIEITNAVKVACPADWLLMTPYVLAEQQDWFEDEIRFLRTAAQPDTVLIDIGANYGLYSLSIAKLSPQGRVWSFEPCGATADFLQKSIAENHFDNVILIRMAVSDTSGSANLLVKHTAEMNALIDGSATDGGKVESVELTTLDAQWQAHFPGKVDIVKIDAEGHEARIIQGGRSFFTSASPLVMCEVKEQATRHLGSAEALTGLGYAPYRLVPGLSVLVPQDLAEPMDRFLLNLFFCKPDRAEMLQRDGRLVIDPAKSSPAPPGAADQWREFLATFHYGRSGLDDWMPHVDQRPDPGWDDYRDTLNLYARSRDQRLDITTRYAALHTGFTRLLGFIEKQTTAARVLSLARMATEYGARNQAINALDYFLNISQQLRPGDFSREPLLSPCAEFEGIAPTGNLHEWAHAAALEAYERLRSYSGYFTDPDLTLKITDALEKMGYLTPQMQIRAELARRRKDRADPAISSGENPGQ